MPSRATSSGPARATTAASSTTARPIGRIFVEHLGEAVFRDDLDNSVLDLGDLLVHEGPALKAQKEAADIFGAEKTYFVLNGTSTSNKIVLSALVAEGDLVLFDRNNHKAAHHGALFLGGGDPDLPRDRPQRLRADRPDVPRGARRDRDPREDPHPSAGHRQGRVAARAPVPRRGRRAMHL